MSDDGTVPRWRMNEVLAERDNARRELATAQDAIKSHALTVADWKSKFETSEGKLKAGKDRYSALEASHATTLGLRDTHDALRKAGIGDVNARDYLLGTVPDGVSPIEHLKALREMESVDNAVLASIVKVEEQQQERVKTPARLNGAAPKHTTRSASDWDKFLASASHAELVANRDAFVADVPQHASSYDATVAILAPPG